MRSQVIDLILLIAGLAVMAAAYALSPVGDLLR